MKLSCKTILYNTNVNYILYFQLHFRHEGLELTRQDGAIKPKANAMPAAYDNTVGMEKSLRYLEIF